MKTLKEKIEVMQAALDGKEIQIRYNDDKNYHPQSVPTSDFYWDWRRNDYRIKPEPRELMVDIYAFRTAEGIYDGEWEVASDKNRELYSGRKILRTIKMIEVLDNE